MNNVPVRSTRRSWTPSRSMSLKLFVIGGLALLMTIPALFVSHLVQERTDRAREVTREVSALVGGEQTFLGPTVAIPYTVASQIAGTPPEQGIYLVFPSQATASVKTSTKERRRSLFNVPVFQSDLALNAAFDLTGVPSVVPPPARYSTGAGLKSWLG